MPPAAADATNRKREPSAARAKRWSPYIKTKMEQKGLRVRDLVARLNNPSYDSGLISAWRSGRAAPSEQAAWDVADALDIPVPETMRAAGYPDMAARLERIAAHGTTPPDPVIEMLESLGKPELTSPLAEEYRRELAAAKRRAELELDQLRRTLARENDEDDGESAHPEAG